MKIAAKLMDWKAKWHLHGKGPVQGSVVTGLGMAIHTWGGGGHPSSCMVKIHPDGGLEAFLASQDLGTGTRTVIATVLAETFGLPIKDVKVNIGNSKYPNSGPSGGSTTVGGVSESTRRTGLDALDQLKKLVADKLKVGADSLVAKDGRIRDANDPAKGLSWKEACSLVGMNPLEVKGRGEPGPKSKLSSNGVGGVQMAEVAVDRDTGVVKMKKFVAVQDMGLVVNRKTAVSQIYGAMIMGIAYSLFEERIMDPKTGAFLNAEIADYKLPRLGDTGELVVEIYEPDSERARGVIGLGEPPVISPGAAISNAVCNALGVRVPVLPLTPKQVLDTLRSKNA
jgi:xanthine dehydrogenase YagR molybdenum-binding subunit